VFVVAVVAAGWISNFWYQVGTLRWYNKVFVYVVGYVGIISAFCFFAVFKIIEVVAKAESRR